jgi:hypothetical protein
MITGVDIGTQNEILPAPAPKNKKNIRSSKNSSWQDPWAEWRPQWSSQKSPGKTVHDHQEQHSPTEAVTLRQPGQRNQQQGYQRIVDARLWEAMTGTQQDAALQIALAFETMGRGLGYVSSNWQRIPGCTGQGNASESHARLIHGYVEWTRRCQKEKISHSMIIDILAFGFSCRRVDQDRRMRSGSARRNLLQGLSLYCLLQGWR